MNKKANTFLFILGGTLFNIIITVASFFVLLFIYSRLVNSVLPESSVNWAFPVICILAIVFSFLAYRLAIKLIMKKIDMEKYFDPLFGPRRPAKKN